VIAAWQEVTKMIVSGIILIVYIVIIALVIAFIVWFIRTLNEIKRSLLRVEMKLMSLDPAAGEPDGGDDPA
jgi:hypothetical protein